MEGSAPREVARFDRYPVILVVRREPHRKKDDKKVGSPASLGRTGNSKIGRIAGMWLPAVIHGEFVLAQENAGGVLNHMQVERESSFGSEYSCDG